MTTTQPSTTDSNLAADPPTPRPIRVTHAASAPRFDLPGVQFISGAAPSLGSDQLCVWTLVVSAGHDSPDPHTVDHDEVFTVTAGTIRLHADAAPLTAGDTAVVPAGTPIQLANPGEQPARVLVAIRAGFRARLADGTEVGTPPWAQ